MPLGVRPVPDPGLLTRAREISTRIRTQVETARLEGEASGIASRADTLAACVEALSQATQLMDAFRAESMTVDWDGKQLQSLKARAIRLKGRYNANPAVILDPNPAIWQALADLPVDAQRRLQTAWRAWIDAVWPSLNTETLGTLATIPELSTAVQDLQVYFDRRASLRGRLPSGPDDFAEVRRLGSETRDAWSALVGSGLHEDVVTFLEAANRGSATLAQLTDAVRDWLERMHLANGVRLSMGSRDRWSR